MMSEFLKINKIRKIGRPPKRDTFKTQGILTVYYYGETVKVL